MPTSTVGVTSDNRFLYTCLGTEGDSFTLTLPKARFDTSYVAIVQLASSTLSWYSCNAPPANYTTTTIKVITGVPVSAGDVLSVVVTEIV